MTISPVLTENKVASNPDVSNQMGPNPSTDNQKKTAIRVSSLIIGAMLGLYVIKNNPIFYAVPLLVIISSLSAVGYFYPKNLLNFIETVKSGLVSKVADIM